MNKLAYMIVAFLYTALLVLLTALLITSIATVFTTLDVSAGYIVSHLFPLSLFDASLLCAIIAALLLGVLFLLQAYIKEEDEKDGRTRPNSFRRLGHQRVKNGDSHRNGLLNEAVT